MRVDLAAMNNAPINDESELRASFTQMFPRNCDDGHWVLAVSLMLAVLGLGVYVPIAALANPIPHPVSVAAVVIKNQTRFVPELESVAVPFMRDDAIPVIVVPTISYRGDHYEKQQRPSAKQKEKDRIDSSRPQKRSNVAQDGYRLASLVPVDDEIEYPRPSWPRITPEQEERIEQERQEQIEPPPDRAWASATPVDIYLSEVYARVPIKRDRSGDFTWKDPIAAKRAGKGVFEYAIGGMSSEFRELLYAAGKRMDAEGIGWSMLSAFRDDYRQSIASGFKARGGNSRHGGSRATCGYGCGEAADVVGADGTPTSRVFAWIDRFGRQFGLHRPMPRYDGAHVQPTGAWRAIASALRFERTGERTQVATAKRAPQMRASRIAARVKASRRYVRYARR